MPQGYITLDRFENTTRDVTGWRAAHPHLVEQPTVFVDMSEPKTAEIVAIDPSRGTSSITQVMAPVGLRPRGYQGLRQNIDLPYQLGLMVLGAGLILLFLVFVFFGTLAVWRGVLPLVFG